MEDDDEIDVLGEFNLESLLKKNEDQISTCYDGEHQLGLHCDSPWILDSTTQPGWYDNRSDPQTSDGIVINESNNANTWSEKEKYLLEKGLELFGRSWSRLAQYIGTKNAGQVKSYVKAIGAGGASRISLSTPSFGLDSIDFNVTELIHDMEIPASIEEVIAVVSTAQPTVQSSAQREVYTSCPHRKKKKRRKKHKESRKSRSVATKPKAVMQVYNAEEIMDVLTGNKERDTIVLPNGEQVIRMRHGTSVSEGSDVEIDIGSDFESFKEEPSVRKESPIEEHLVKEGHHIEDNSTVNVNIGDTKNELFNESLYQIQNVYDGTLDVYVDDIGKEVCVFTDEVEEVEEVSCKVQKETQIFKGNLVTPSGKVMTVIVDDVSDNYPKTPDYEQCHPNTSDQPRDQTNSGNVKTDNSGYSRGVSVPEKQERNKPRNKKLPFQETSVKNNKCTPRNTKSQQIKDVKSGSNGKGRKKKISSSDHDGSYTLLHADSGEVFVRNRPSPNKISTRGIKPIKLIQCKNYSSSNKAPYRVELEVLALLLVDVHSHLSPRCEVIGLLGGVYCTQNNVLSITTAVPCRTILSSNVHCDMCPVSQCESSELIISKGLSVVGWYHSHPNFDPSPSDTDVDTQSTLQSWFNETGKPFVGLIISPYFSFQNVSSYRCCQVKMENNVPVPYQMEVKVTSFSDGNILSLRQSMEAAFKTLPVQKNEPIKNLSVYKCLESIKFHLRKATPKFEEEKLPQVLNEIRDFFKKLSVNKSLLKGDR